MQSIKQIQGLAQKIPGYFPGKIKRNRIIRWGIIGLISFVLITFLSRSVIVTWYIQRKISHFNESHNARLAINTIRIKALSSVLVHGITLKPDQGDTLLRIDTASMTIGFWKLITGRVQIKELKLHHISVSLIRKDSSDNYSFLMDRGKHITPEDTIIDEGNYASRASVLSDAVFTRIPGFMEIDDFTLTWNNRDHPVKLHFDQFKIADHHFKTSIDVAENDSTSIWITEGSIDDDAQKVTFRLYPGRGSKIFIPYISYRYKALIGFDTVLFRFEERVSPGEITTISGSAGVSGLEVNHEKIAASTVVFDRLGFDFSVNFGNDYMELDSSSLVTFNKLTFHPYIRYRPKPSKQFTLKIHKPDFPADELFSSIPVGLFTNFSGVTVKGDLSYYLDFFVDLSLPDSLRFDSELKRKKFYVSSYGNLDLYRINGSFPYTAYEHGKPVRTFIIGPENPNYRPLDRISDFLKVSVLNSEDGGFYLHRGFLMDAFRESIITNIKERKFVRGGSTITMQLVKNVFLQRNKTVGRKLEEALLVWLIENQQLATKDRMFEVYLNIIEWGPLIYGANEASRFYFSKDASKLNLAEAIFLASIIPKPKWFRYSFDENGHLRESLAGFYRLLSGKMLKKGQITQEEYDKLIPEVNLKGPAKLLLRKPGPLPADSINPDAGQEDDIWN